MRTVLACLLMVLLSLPAMAVQPGEMLDDPALEERARDISSGLRCLVCRNESIDESNAELARDLRLLVRERLVEGDTDEQVVAYIVDRYGEYVLLRPTADGVNLILWLAGPAMLLLGLGMAAAFVRNRARSDPGQTDPLSEAESQRIRDIMGD